MPKAKATEGAWYGYGDGGRRGRRRVMYQYLTSIRRPSQLGTEERKFYEEVHEYTKELSAIKRKTQ